MDLPQDGDQDLTGKDGGSENETSEKAKEVIEEGEEESNFDILDAIRARCEGGEDYTKHVEEKLNAFHHEILASEIPEEVHTHSQPRRRERGTADTPPQAATAAEEPKSDHFDVMKIVQERAREANGETNEPNHESQSQVEQQQFSKPGVPSRGVTGQVAGAYTEAPGASVHHLNHVRYSILGIPGQQNQSMGAADPNKKPVSQVTKHSTTQLPTEPAPALIEADPVRESTIADAEPVDLDESELKSKRLRSKRILIVAGMALIFVLIILLAIGFVVIKKKEATVRSTTSMTPTAPPPPVPSEAPSAAPSFALYQLINNLPDYTIESLQDPSTAQSKALAWLYRHWNISNFEEWRKTQLFAMATFYFAFKGPSWPHGLANDWLDYSKPECAWFSSTFGSSWYDNGHFMGYQSSDSCNEQGEFQHLHLVGSLDLAGQSPFFPPEIGLLTSLTSIHLGDNEINVSLADMIVPLQAHLSNLTDLFLDGNPLGNTLPSEIGLMSNLHTLSLVNAFATGSIPSEIGLLSNMAFFNVGINFLSGNLPTEIGGMSSLLFLKLSGNSLSGNIPSECGQLEGLKSLTLSDNNLSGPLPTELGLATELRSLLLSSNSLGLLPTGNVTTSAIPSELALLTQLQYLWIHDNSLLGSLPNELSTATASLHVFFFSDNPLLSGTIPSDLCFLESPSCVYLAISNTTANPSTGEIFFTYANCSCSMEYDCTDLLCGCNCSCALPET